jgi:hypothetical protein
VSFQGKAELEGWDMGQARWNRSHERTEARRGLGRASDVRARICKGTYGQAHWVFSCSFKWHWEWRFMDSLEASLWRQ